MKTELMTNSQLKREFGNGPRVVKNVELTVNVELKEPICFEDLEQIEEYVAEAVEAWRGGYHPDDMLFNTVGGAVAEIASLNFSN